MRKTAPAEKSTHSERTGEDAFLASTEEQEAFFAALDERAHDDGERMSPT